MKKGGLFIIILLVLATAFVCAERPSIIISIQNISKLNYDIGKNPFDQSLNTTDSPVFANFNASIKYTHVGNQSGFERTGDYLTALGYRAGYQTSTQYATLIGEFAGSGSSGDENVFVGFHAGQSSSGNYNTLIGSYAGASGSGRSNVFLGNRAGQFFTGDYSIGIGDHALLNAPADGENNTIAIGYGAGNTNAVPDQFILHQTHINAIPLIQGNFSSGFVGIGTISPSSKLDVNGSANILGNVSASWFKGKFNWTSADDYNIFDGSVLDFNESKLEVSYFNASSVDVIIGTLDGGDLSCIQSFGVCSYNVSETNADPGLDIRINFTGITDFNQLIFRFKTDAGTDHQTAVQLYDFVNDVWGTHDYYIEAHEWDNPYIPIHDSDIHISGDGVVAIRIFLDDMGKLGHTHFLDWVGLSLGFATFSTTEADPLSYHRDENINASNFNISASYYFGDGSLLSNLPTAGNLSWNQSLANTLYWDISDGSYNATYNSYAYNVSLNYSQLTFDNWNSDWLSTFNLTYDNYALNVSRNWTLDTYTNWNTIWSAQTSIWDATFNTSFDARDSDTITTIWDATFNTSFDARDSDTTYSDLSEFNDNIFAGFNHTLQTYTNWNTDWLSTYNASYVPYSNAVSNVGIGIYNLTASHFIGDGSLLTGVTGVSTSWNRTGTNVSLHHTGDNVGIGTATPEVELHIYGGTNSHSQIVLESDGVAYNPAMEWRGSTSIGYINIDNDATNEPMYIGRSGGASITILDNLNVGIGVATPSFPLHVNSGTALSQFMVTGNNVGGVSILNYAPDNAGIFFDAYWSNAWKSTDAGSNFGIYKIADRLTFVYDTGVAVGGTITWNNGMIMDGSGNLDVAGNLDVVGNLDIGMEYIEAYDNDGAQSAYCSAGKKLTGGGCRCGGIQEIQYSRPRPLYPNTWECVCSGTPEIWVYAICGRV